MDGVMAWICTAKKHCDDGTALYALQLVYVSVQCLTKRAEPANSAKGQRDSDSDSVVWFCCPTVAGAGLQWKAVRIWCVCVCVSLGVSVCVSHLVCLCV